MDKIRIAFVTENDFYLPEKANENDACYDLKAFDVIKEYTPGNIKSDVNFNKEEIYELKPGHRCLVHTGLTLADVQPPMFELQIRPRSGLALKNGITVLNTPGTVDAGYRNMIGVILINHSTFPFTIKKNDRIAQMKIDGVIPSQAVEIIGTDKVTESQRGEGGFGSTGK